ncbi:PIN domain-containing protein [Saccharothrix hoggarensis]|uniref:PIN domain-containing protein n=1 Tax=Saccharothrix hoggarensis TaxID=913853 RepID=A0ABW3R2H9_9PSEU
MGDHHVGVLDTSTYIDLDLLDQEALPETFELTTVTFAELQHGVAVAGDATTHDARAKRLGVAMVNYDPLPFDRRASTRYGSLIRLTIAAIAILGRASST